MGFELHWPMACIPHKRGQGPKPPLRCAYLGRKTGCQNEGRSRKPPCSTSKPSPIELWSNAMHRTLEEECGTGEGIDVPPTLTKPRIHACKGAIFGSMDPATLLGAPSLLQCLDGQSEPGLTSGAMEASIAAGFSRSRLLPRPQATPHRPPAWAVSMVAQAAHSHRPLRPLHTSDDGGSRREARGAAEHATYRVQGPHQHLSVRQHFRC